MTRQQFVQNGNQPHQIHPDLSTRSKSVCRHTLIVAVMLTIIGTILRSSFLINLFSSAASTSLVGITTSCFSSPDFSVGDEVPDSSAIGVGCSASLRKKPMACSYRNVWYQRAWKGYVKLVRAHRGSCTDRLPKGPRPCRLILIHFHYPVERIWRQAGICPCSTPFLHTLVGARLSER